MIFLSRMERPGDRDMSRALQRPVRGTCSSVCGTPEARKSEPGRSAELALPLLPQIVDTYILSNFLFYLGGRAGELRLHDPESTTSSS